MNGALQLPNGTLGYRFDPQTRQWRKNGDGCAAEPQEVKLPTLILRGARRGLVRAAHARG